MMYVDRDRFEHLADLLGKPIEIDNAANTAHFVSGGVEYVTKLPPTVLVGADVIGVGA